MTVVTQDAIPEPLQRPPVSWSLSTLLIVKVGGGCEATTLLTTPLAERTPALALLCLTEEEEKDVTEGMSITSTMTWLPYSPQGPRLLPLGPWSLSAFPSFQSLFPQRFNTLGGAEVAVASDDADAPLVFKDEEKGFDGTSVRLLGAVARRMNFTYTLTTQAPDSE